LLPHVDLLVTAPWSWREDGSHYKAFRRWTDEPERITSNERKGRLRSRSENVHFVRLYNSGRLHDVDVIFRLPADLYHVSYPDATQGTKESIAMRRQYCVSTVPRQRRAGKVSGSALQNVLIGALKYNRRQVQPWNL
jgi:hypothetical protein